MPTPDLAESTHRVWTIAFVDLGSNQHNGADFSQGTLEEEGETSLNEWHMLPLVQYSFLANKLDIYHDLYL